MLVMSSPFTPPPPSKKVNVAETVAAENCCPELEFDMWDGQFEFVGNAYRDGPDASRDADALDLPKINRKQEAFVGAPKVIRPSCVFFFFSCLFSHYYWTTRPAAADRVRSRNYSSHAFVYVFVLLLCFVII